MQKEFRGVCKQPFCTLIYVCFGLCPIYINNKNTVNNLFKTLRPYIITFFGTAMTAAAVSLFYLPNKIVNGGATGVSTILYYVFDTPAALTFALINIVLLLLGLKVLGKEFILKTLYGAGLMSVFVQLFSMLPPATEDIFLATIFGAALYGCGLGISLAAGASTGGTDILGRLIQYKFSHLPIGKLLLIVDGIIIMCSFLAFGNIELVLYGVIALFISTFVIDFLIKRLNVSKLAFVVSHKGDDIAKTLVSSSRRGVTILNATGAYTYEKTKILICALKENEVPAFQRIILSVDENAFIIFSESSQIVGNGFYVYH